MRQLVVAKSVFTVLLLSCSILPVHAEIIETVYYDSITSANGIIRTGQGRPTSTSAISDPNNEFGRSFTANAFNTVGTGPITRMDFLLSATASELTSYQSIRVNAQFWDSFGGNLGTTWFANPSSLKSNVYNTLGGLPPNFTFLGATTGTASDFSLYRVSVLFDAPVSFTDANLNGITLNIQGNNGSGFFNTNNLSTYRTRGNGYVAGSSPILQGEDDRGGYLRNNRGRIDYNFTNDQNVPGTDLFFAPRDSNESLGVRLYNQVVVPEMNTLLLVAFGAVIPVVGLVRRRKR